MCTTIAALVVVGSGYGSPAAAIEFPYFGVAQESTVSLEEMFPSDPTTVAPSTALSTAAVIRVARLHRRPVTLPTPTPHFRSATLLRSAPPKIDVALDSALPELVDLHPDWPLTETGFFTPITERAKRDFRRDIAGLVEFELWSESILDRMARMYRPMRYSPKVITLVPIRSPPIELTTGTSTVTPYRGGIFSSAEYFGLPWLPPQMMRSCDAKPRPIACFTARFHYRGTLSPTLIDFVAEMFAEECRRVAESAD